MLRMSQRTRRVNTKMAVSVYGMCIPSRDDHLTDAILHAVKPAEPAGYAWFNVNTLMHELLVFEALNETEPTTPSIDVPEVVIPPMEVAL